MKQPGVRVALSALILIVAVVPVSAEEAAKPAKDLVGSKTAEQSKWDGQQVLSATAKGEVLLLRSDSLTATSFASRKRARLVRDGSTPATPDELFVRAAAVGADPASWVVLDLASVRLFEKGAEVPVADTGWEPHWVTMAGGDPVAVTLPLKQRMQAEEKIERFPLLLRWDGEEWRTLAEDDPIDEAESADRMRVRERRAAIAAGGKRGRIWVANAYRYRLRSYTSGGKLELDARIDEGSAGPLISPETELARQEEMLAEFEKSAAARGGRVKSVTAQASIAEQQIFGLAEGPDGRLYLLVRDTESGGGKLGSNLGMDRYDPSTLLLERVTLGVAWQGWSRIAAGTDGLYIAPFHAGTGERRFFAWEELEAAPWRVVPGLEVSSRTDEEEN